MSLIDLVAQNRQRLTAQLLPDSIAVCFADNTLPGPGTPALPGQPDALYWLTGLTQPSACLLLFPQHPEPRQREILFIERAAAWRTAPLSAADAAARSGIGTVHWLDELENVFAGLAPAAQHLYLSGGEGFGGAGASLPAAEQFARWCRWQYPRHDYQPLAPLLNTLRAAKTSAELEQLRRAAQFATAGFHRLLGAVQPGLTARQLEAELAHEYARTSLAWTLSLQPAAADARRAAPPQAGRAGDLLQVHLAVADELYPVFVTRTVPVDGQYSPRQRAVYDAVLRVSRGVGSYARAGLSPHDIQQHGDALLLSELQGLGLFTPEELQRYGPAYYLQQYTRPAVEPDGSAQAFGREPLPAGATLTVAPSIHLAAEGLSACIGNTLVLTANGAEELTAGVPVEADEIEALLEQESAAVPRAAAESAPAIAPLVRAPRTARSAPAAPAPTAAPASNTLRSKLWRHAYWLLLLPLLLDLGYSYVQHLNVPHDGDMVALVLPRIWIQQVLDEPFGLRALLKGESYVGPNRYFAHETLYLYMHNVPLALQAFVDPIYSTYMASAIAKIIIQIALLSLLAYYISEQFAFNPKYFLLAAILITPLFQTAGYHDQMGIIDRALTYTIFYALPLTLLLVYFIPFYRNLFTPAATPISRAWHIVLPVLAVVLALNGPLTPAVAGMMCGSLLLYLWWRNFQAQSLPGFVPRAVQAVKLIPRAVLWQLGWFILCGMYSLYIGTYNIENIATVTLGERYSKLYEGMWIELGRQPAFPLLVLAVLINTRIIRRNFNTVTSARILTAARWLLILSAIYILLLPLGGYRSARPYIVRRDSVMPVTLALVYLFGTSSIYLLYHLKRLYKPVYITALIGLMAFYSTSDISNLKENNCEVDSMRIIANSPEKIVHLEQDCSIMNWGTITDYKNSEEQSKMMKYWRIMKEEKLFYH
ncbi:M24 family metallopeptidase [Hymenobacter gummosus]|uniref:Xaa-Pro aminopeptidase n=1 Tax=Hymenobacter gummosus TaxID=1776032 RepID=A0A3S0QIT3_9BACT|nr:aminopeptidase P N-terminal domain-containing protein [Hymenobacter gummosus]RTQ50662.1 M24 family metallopeptidase [Hymenobacter gummosus]